MGNSAALAHRIRVLGLDPGLASTGWGWVEWDAVQGKVTGSGWGVIKTSPDDEIGDRVRSFRAQFEPIFWDAIHPNANFYLAAESYQNYGRVLWNGVQTLYVLGVLIAESDRLGYMVSLIGARHSKLLIGVKDGEKETTRARVTQLLGLKKPPTPIHASDALCVALARLKQLGELDPGLNIQALFGAARRAA